jgi:predicted DNA-binding protein (MmcQ/YjbR family)
MPTTERGNFKKITFKMDILTAREYCLTKPGTTEDTPFDEVTLVVRVMGKIFAFLPLDADPPSISLKCDPERAESLRETHPEITPGWHLNKKHWNGIDLSGNLSDALLLELIDHSYALVVGGLKKAEKEALKQLNS